MRNTEIYGISSVGNRKAMRTFYFIILFFVLYAALFVHSSYAAEQQTTIVSKTLEYFSNLRKYVARGSVRIEQKDTVITSDDAVYHEDTGETLISGNMTYTDSKISIKASGADFNMESRTGKLHDSDIYIRQNNYHIKAKEIEKKGENEYEGRGEMSFTTCEGIPPDWCFKGRDLKLLIGDKIQAKDVTFSIRDVPVLYTPALWASVLTERKTGFLTPVVSNSVKKGFGLQVPFYWVISENRDATILLDSYTERGLGTGVEYRYVKPFGIKGNWWLYHIYDNKLDTDFVELKGVHESRDSMGSGWFLNVNFVNEGQFYKEFNPYKEKQVQRFLESTGEFSIPFENSRLYLLSQYWVDLKYNTGDIPQRLPEFGYIMNYTKFGSFLISADAVSTDMWSKNGLSAGRVDIYPRVLHTYGDDIVFTQIAAARATAYSFYGEDYKDNDLLRSAFEYIGSVHTRLYRDYGPFTHAIEPTLRYHYISISNNDLPVFDATEFFGQRSRMEVGVVNRFFAMGSEVADISLLQPVDLDHGDRPFAPLELEMGIIKPLPVKLEASYNVSTARMHTLSSEVLIPFGVGIINLGQRYNRDEKIMTYKAGVDIRPVKSILMSVNAWYDAKGEGLTEMTAKIGYESQCWGIRLEVSKKPGDFSIQILFDLFGVTAKPSGV